MYKDDPRAERVKYQLLNMLKIRSEINQQDFKIVHPYLSKWIIFTHWKLWIASARHNLWIAAVMTQLPINFKLNDLAVKGLTIWKGRQSCHSTTNHAHTCIVLIYPGGCYRLKTLRNELGDSPYSERKQYRYQGNRVTRRFFIYIHIVGAPLSQFCTDLISNNTSSHSPDL